MLTEAEQNDYGRAIGVDIDRRKTSPVGVIHDWISRHDDELAVWEGVANPGFVLIVGNLVRDNEDLPLRPLGRHEYSTLRHVD